MDFKQSYPMSDRILVTGLPHDLDGRLPARSGDICHAGMRPWNQLAKPEELNRLMMDRLPENFPASRVADAAGAKRLKQ